MGKYGTIESYDRIRRSEGDGILRAVFCQQESAQTAKQGMGRRLPEAVLDACNRRLPNCKAQVGGTDKGEHATIKS